MSVNSSGGINIVVVFFGMYKIVIIGFDATAFIDAFIMRGFDYLENMSREETLWTMDTNWADLSKDDSSVDSPM